MPSRGSLFLPKFSLASQSRLALPGNRDPGTSSVARPRKQLWSWRDRSENDRESCTVARPIVNKEHGVDGRGDSRSLTWEESVKGNVLSAMISGAHSPVNYMSAVANSYRICVTVYTWHNVAGERAHE